MRKNPPESTLAPYALALCVVVVLIAGQVGRELLPPDELREVEVAREMQASSDVAVPHLAGLPFVEKPPGFQAVLALAFAVARGPSVAAARAVTIAFALGTVLAVFLLAKRAFDAEAGAWAAALLALSSRFARTAHTVLLDGALAATLAFALLFFWIALEAEARRAKRRAYAACALMLGLSFLVKGFVGPGLFAAGALAFFAWSGRWRELRDALSPAPIAVGLATIALWIVPFLLRAPPDLARKFFSAALVRRFAAGEVGHSKPIWFYGPDLLAEIAPISLLLPFAALAAWRERRAAGARPLGFFLATGLGPVALLSLSRAKESVYLLPAFAPLACLAGGWMARVLREGSRAAKGLAATALAIGALGALAAIVATGVLGGVVATAASGVVAIALVAHVAKRWRSGDVRAAALGGAALCALAWALWFTGPIAAIEIRRRSIREPMEAVLRVAGTRDVLLFHPSDGVRGAAGIQRDRTALEIEDADRLVEALAARADVVALVRQGETSGVTPILEEAARRRGITLIAEASAPLPDARCLAVVRAEPRDQPGR
jgi:4-amino-4-deoxy-L-arabinose transferase-like glycosyltransferase